MVLIGFLLTGAPVMSQSDPLTDSVMAYWRCGYEELSRVPDKSRQDAVDLAMTRCAQHESSIAAEYSSVIGDFPDPADGTSREDHVQTFLNKRRDELRYKLKLFLSSGLDKPQAEN